MAGCVPTLTVLPGPPVELWLDHEDGSWSQFDLLGRLQQYIEPCSDDGVLGWALKHAKVTGSGAGTSLP